MPQPVWINLFIPITVILLLIILIQYIRYRSVITNQTKILLASRRIYKLILQDLDFNSVVQKIADTIPNELQFGTGVVAILDENKGIIKRIAASKTPEAQQAISALKVPFEQIEISINDPHNLMARAMRDKKPYITNDVYDVLGPVLSKEESQKIQQIMGTKTTFVYPIFLNERPIGVFIASAKKDSSQITPYEWYIIDDFVNLVGLFLQNSKLYTSLKLTKNDLSMVNKKLEYANLKLMELDKLKDDFVSIASHELRTPMTAIRSYAWMALNRSDIPLSDRMKKYLSRTLLSTERLINLVNDMLNISRIESGRVEIMPKKFNILTLVDDVLSEIEAKAKEKNLNLKLDSKTALTDIFADQDKVHQILLNLLGNAMKFTPNGGDITISFFSDGQQLETAIKDSGVGITKEDQTRLFKKFGRLDNSYVAAATSGGTGLGLYICKSLIDLMKGKIYATSEGLNKGSTFAFSLPLATAEVLSRAEQYTNRVDGTPKVLEPISVI